jgi:hypothetical protein
VTRLREDVDSTARRTLTRSTRILGALQLDGPLVLGLALIALYGQFVLYSASGGDWNAVMRGSIRLCIGALAMLVCAQIKPGRTGCRVMRRVVTQAVIENFYVNTVHQFFPVK